MRVQYSELLSLYYCRFLASQFAVPEPPSEEEVVQELAGLERLEEALKEE